MVRSSCARLVGGVNLGLSVVDPPDMDAATSSAVSDVVIGDALGALPLKVQCAVLALTVVTAVWVYRRPGVLPILGFAVCVLVWERANQRLEGAVLLTFAPSRGLTVADLLPPALVASILVKRMTQARALVKKLPQIR
jgi:hypothetical protein